MSANCRRTGVSSSVYKIMGKAFLQRCNQKYLLRILQPNLQVLALVLLCVKALLSRHREKFGLKPARAKALPSTLNCHWQIKFLSAFLPFQGNLRIVTG